MLDVLPVVKEVPEFDPPKFVVMFAGEAGGLHDTRESAQYEAKTIRAVNKRLAKLMPVQT